MFNGLLGPGEAKKLYTDTWETEHRNALRVCSCYCLFLSGTTLSLLADARQMIHGWKVNKTAVVMKKWYIWVRRFLFIIHEHQYTKTTSLQIIDLFMREKKVCRCASLYPTLDASCPPLIPQRSLWWRRLLEGGQEPWRELRGRPLSLHQLRIQCCSATGPQHAGRVPRNCDSGVLLCL